VASRARFLHFIRHGQYTSSPEGGVLTAKGRRQAKRTGKKLAATGIDVVHASTLSRAIESAELLAAEVGQERVRKTKILCECLPTGVRGASVSYAKRQEGRENIESIVRRYFKPSRSERHEAFLCHGNLIRALCCRVLEVRMNRWIRMDIHNGGITTFAVLPGGHTRLVRFNDYGHLPPSLVTEY
jgi:serine/threonine-protein phosphatase PGAM5